MVTRWFGHRGEGGTSLLVPALCEEHEGARPEAVRAPVEVRVGGRRPAVQQAQPPQGEREEAPVQPRHSGRPEGVLGSAVVRCGRGSGRSAGFRAAGGRDPGPEPPREDGDEGRLARGGELVDGLGVRGRGVEVAEGRGGLQADEPAEHGEVRQVVPGGQIEDLGAGPVPLRR